MTSPVTTAAATAVADPAGTQPAGGGRRARRRTSGGAGETAAGYAFLTPTLILLGVFVLLPLGGAVVTSLQRTNGFGSGSFVGLDNYARLATDSLFWRSTLNTFLFTVIVTPVAMAIGLGAAVLLNTVLPARGLLRSILILPMAISGVATALMGLLVFDENNGLLDKLLGFVGLPTVPWQSGGTAAFASVVLVTLWWRLGFNMLIYLAGLQGISPEVYEAAKLDGAGGWQRFRYMTVPLVGPSTFFLLIMNVIYSFQVFDLIFVMTGGGPQNATSVLVTYAYDTGFVTRDQGYAAAIGVVLLVLMLAFTAVQWKTSRTRDQVG
ncbi:sugar ABC transporter permease [Nakamurella flavida]|uniref:Sugar ABC transporter permease n=1 Tax=Nakamurella flavida TaxID=363630 RepID=A0A938YNE0_9ACTN|nr:sugar ABC transporter permease [Nakamurella flavida]MBM9477918.1 sugar ABC transporter permease [Nakamurella flavida]MDP9778367.1 multiple sugar transport system permease protein [Nakamurella flavida]